MAVQVLGKDGTTLAAIDAGHDAQRVSLRPTTVLAWSSFGMQTGTVTTLAAGAPIFSLRNVGTNLLLVRRVSLGWITTTTFTAAQRVEFGLYVARSFSSGDTGGTALTTTSGKHRTSLTNPAVDARIATTTALTAGVRTVDAHPVGVASAFSGAVGATMPQTPLLSHDAGDHPIVLANLEGILISNLFLMGAAGVGVAYVNVEFAETASF